VGCLYVTMWNDVYLNYNLSYMFFPWITSSVSFQYYTAYREVWNVKLLATRVYLQINELETVLSFS